MMAIILFLGPTKGGACTILAPPDPSRPRVESDSHIVIDNAPVTDQRGLCDYRACIKFTATY